MNNHDLMTQIRALRGEVAAIRSTLRSYGVDQEPEDVAKRAADVERIKELEARLSSLESAQLERGDAATNMVAAGAQRFTPDNETPGD